MKYKITSIRNIVELLYSKFPQSMPYNPQLLTVALGGECVPLTAYRAGIAGYPSTFEAKAVLPDSPYAFRVEYAAWKPEEEIRFAIAHELGFLLLYSLQPDGVISFRNNGRPRTSEEVFYANEFAAELLMPVSGFVSACRDNAEENEGKIAVEAIVATFGVTKPAALVRGGRLGIW